MKLKTRITTFLIALMVIGFSNAQEKKVASPAEMATGKINGATITIKYGSPSVKGREIWGKLVPFNEVWRAGANDATTFTTDKDIMIEGSKLAAGTYSFFIIPNKDNCVLIFNSDAKQWGSYKHKDEKDVLRVTVNQKPMKDNVEKLLYTVNKNQVELSWEKWNIGFKVQ